MRNISLFSEKQLNLGDKPRRNMTEIAAVIGSLDEKVEEEVIKALSLEKVPYIKVFDSSPTALADIYQFVRSMRRIPRILIVTGRDRSLPEMLESELQRHPDTKKIEIIDLTIDCDSSSRDEESLVLVAGRPFMLPAEMRLLVYGAESGAPRIVVPKIVLRKVPESKLPDIIAAVIWSARAETPVTWVIRGRTHEI